MPATTRFATGLLTASGLIDNMIPPSIAMILFAAIAEQSVVQIFTAGIVPGILFALAFCGLRLVKGHRSAVDRPEPFSLAALHGKRQRVLGARTAVLILGGIYSGVITATEAGGIACVYAILVSARDLPRDQWPDLRASPSARPTSRRR